MSIPHPLTRAELQAQNEALRASPGPTPGPWRSTPQGGSVLAGKAVIALIAEGPARKANATLIAAAPDLQTQNEILRKALVRATDELAHLTGLPMPWTLRIDGQYLKTRTDFEDAKAWGEVLAQVFPTVPIAVVTA